MHHLFIYLFICWSCRMAALRLCYHSIAPCTCEDDISASVICHLYRFCFQVQYIGRPKQASYFCFGGLSYGSSFCFAASRIQSTNWRQLTVPSSLLYIVLQIYFRSLKCIFLEYVRRATVSLNSNNNNNHGVERSYRRKFRGWELQ